MKPANPPPPTFGQRLKLLRDESGLTQVELADAAGLTSTAIARYERGERQPAWPAVLALAAALDVDVGAFQQPAAADGK